MVPLVVTEHRMELEEEVVVGSLTWFDCWWISASEEEALIGFGIEVQLTCCGSRSFAVVETLDSRKHWQPIGISCSIERQRMLQKYQGRWE